MLYTIHSLQVDRDGNPTRLSTPRSLSSTLQAIAEIQAQPTATNKAALRTQYGIREDPNPLLTIPADLFRYGLLFHVSSALK